MLTQQRLRELYSYSPETGLFTRLTSTNSRWKIGTIAGNIRDNGYVYIKIDGKLYSAHRLAWLYTYGVFPYILDHKDRDPGNNRIANLRETNKSLNMSNSVGSATRASKYKGVYKNTRGGNYKAVITHNYRTYYLGTYKTQEEAQIVYQKKAKELFGEFADDPHYIWHDNTSGCYALALATLREKGIREGTIEPLSAEECRWAKEGPICNSKLESLDACDRDRSIGAEQGSPTE